MPPLDRAVARRRRRSSRCSPTPRPRSRGWPAGCAAWIALVARIVSRLAVGADRLARCAGGDPGLRRSRRPSFRRLPRYRRRTAVVGLVSLALATAAGAWALRPAPSWAPPQGLRVTFLDVGQGDSACSRLRAERCSSTRGRRRRTSPGSCDELRAPLPDGDRAHPSAARPHRRRRGRARPAACRARSTTRASRRRPADHDAAIAAARRRAVPVEVVARRATRSGSAGCASAILWPDEPGLPSEDPNQHAVVALASYGATDVLLTADAESDVTSRLPAPAGRGPEGRAPRLGGSGSARPAARAAAADRGDLGRGGQRLRSSAAGDARGAATRFPGSDASARTWTGGSSSSRTARTITVAAGSGSLAVGGRRPELKPVYLVTGSDRPKIDRTLDAAPGPLRPGRDRAVHGRRAGRRIRRGRRRRVQCRDAARRTAASSSSPRSTVGRDDRGRVTGGWKAADVEAVVEYLAAPAPGTVLCLVAEELKKDSPLAKACAKAGDVLDLGGREEGKLDQWVAEEFATRGVKVERAAPVTALVQTRRRRQARARSRGRQDRDVGRRRAGRHGRGRAARGRASAERPPWDLTDAWGDHDVATALEVVRGEARRAARCPGARRRRALAGSLGAHLTRLRRLKRLAREGLRPKDAAAG